MPAAIAPLSRAVKRAAVPPEITLKLGRSSGAKQRGSDFDISIGEATGV